jgi:hypothetical protein
LTYEELDEILTKHPHRSSESYGRHLDELVRRATPNPPFDIPCRVDTTTPKYLEKIIRLIQEVMQCPDGKRKALHLYVFTKPVYLRTYPDLGLPPPPGPYQSPEAADAERLDNEVIELVRKSQEAVFTKKAAEACSFFGFATARRYMFSSLPRWCRSCTRPPPSPQSQQNAPFPDPFDHLFPQPGCSRAPHLQLLERVQKWAHAEISTGIMLTLGPKLPKELCMLVLEFALTAEDLPQNPLVWERDDFLMGMVIKGGLKTEYRCPVRSGRWGGDFD